MGKEIKSYFDIDGAIGLAFDSGYEERPGQAEMAEVVADTLFNSKLAIVEAGTGTGKTFAYLVPAILYAVENQKRVVVATKTINLQEQIIYKDIPFLKDALGINFKAAILKGRGNYLCRRKFAHLENYDVVLDKEEKAEMKDAAGWFPHLKEGTIGEFYFKIANSLWQKISSDSDSCLKNKCPFFDSCFFFKAKKRALYSEIIVVNHHLLFADLNMVVKLMREGGTANGDAFVIPDFNAVIIDEGHNIEDAATSIFSFCVNADKLNKLISFFYHASKKGDRGYLVELRKKFKNKFRDIETLLENVISDIRIFGDEATVVFKSFEKLFEKRSIGTKYLLIDDKLYDSFEYSNYIVKGLFKISDLLNSLKTSLKLLISGMSLPKYKEKYSDDISFVESLLSKISDETDAISVFVEKGDNTLIRWVVNTTFGVSLFCAPLNIKRELKEALFDKCSSVVITSATLSVAGSFSYFKERLGIDEIEKDIGEKIFKSPFDYKNQVLLGILTDMPDPNAVSFEPLLTERLKEFLSATGGKSFVLFTSYAMLNRVYDGVKDFLYKNGITPLRQGELSRTDLLDKFRSDVSSVLFATDSFWEGVDVAGESLSNVFIVRLPFQVPDDPVVKSRISNLKAEGKDSFYGYVVPYAVLKFRQGFGRLVRSKNDRGTVVVLDSRIVNKKYGKSFMNSLPGSARVIGSYGKVLKAVKDWTERKDAISRLPLCPLRPRR